MKHSVVSLIGLFLMLTVGMFFVTTLAQQTPLDFGDWTVWLKALAGGAVMFGALYFTVIRHNRDLPRGPKPRD